MKNLFLITVILLSSYHPALAQNKVYENYKDNTADGAGFTRGQDQMVRIVSNGARAFYIDRYEAVIADRKAWSMPGQRPTTRLTYQDAVDACNAAGKRICKLEEWQIACRGGKTQKTPTANPKQLLQVCDFARGKPYGPKDYVNKSDSHPRCLSPKYELHHVFGNITEFVEGPGRKITVMGPAYYDTHITDREYYMKIACEHTVHAPGVYPATRHNEGLGFRCCRDAR